MDRCGRWCTVAKLRSTRFVEVSCQPFKVRGRIAIVSRRMVESLAPLLPELGINIQNLAGLDGIAQAVRADDA